MIYPEGVKNYEQVDCKVTGCNNNNPSPTDYHPSIAVNAGHMPFLNDETSMHILQRPGETIYLPYGHVHSAYNFQETVGVTHSYVSVGNLCKVWGELVTSDNPRHWKYVYNNVLNRRQREMVRSTYFWPPEYFEDWLIDNDVVYGPLSNHEDDREEIPHRCPKYNY